MAARNKTFGSGPFYIAIFYFEHSYCNELGTFCLNLLLLCQHFALIAFAFLSIIPIILLAKSMYPYLAFKSVFFTRKSISNVNRKKKCLNELAIASWLMVCEVLIIISCILHLCSYQCDHAGSTECYT